MGQITENDELAFATGYCMFAWGKVEVAVYSLFSALFSVNDVTAAVAVWDAILSFKDKLKATDGAFQAALGVHPDYREYLDLWNKLAPIISSHSKLRNEVAHATLKTVRKRQRLVPYFSFSNAHAQGLTVAMIEHRTKEFEKTAEAVFYLRRYAGQIIGSVPKSVLREPELIRELRQQISIPAKPRKRRQPSRK